MGEKHCKTCRYSKDMLYRQVICNKTNEWQSELYSCEGWATKEKDGEACESQGL
jgi:hypothetical protein